jgi:hypothetical protein
MKRGSGVTTKSRSLLRNPSLCILEPVARMAWLGKSSLSFIVVTLLGVIKPSLKFYKAKLWKIWTVMSYCGYLNVYFCLNITILVYIVLRRWLKIVSRCKKLPDFYQRPTYWKQNRRVRGRTVYRHIYTKG